MISFRPKSVQLKPPETMPPKCLLGSSSATFSPSRAALTAAITPPAVPPYTTTSNFSAQTAGQGRMARIAIQRMRLFMIPSFSEFLAYAVSWRPDAIRQDSFRYQLIYRPIFQFEAAFVRWRAESSILFSFDTDLPGG